MISGYTEDQLVEQSAGFTAETQVAAVSRL